MAGQQYLLSDEAMSTLLDSSLGPRRLSRHIPSLAQYPETYVLNLPPYVAKDISIRPHPYRGRLRYTDLVFPGTLRRRRTLNIYPHDVAALASIVDRLHLPTQQITPGAKAGFALELILTGFLVRDMQKLNEARKQALVDWTRRG